MGDSMIKVGQTWIDQDGEEVKILAIDDEFIVYRGHFLEVDTVALFKDNHTRRLMAGDTLEAKIVKMTDKYMTFSLNGHEFTIPHHQGSDQAVRRALETQEKVYTKLPKVGNIYRNKAANLLVQVESAKGRYITLRPYNSPDYTVPTECFSNDYEKVTLPIKNEVIIHRSSGNPIEVLDDKLGCIVFTYEDRVDRLLHLEFLEWVYE